MEPDVARMDRATPEQWARVQAAERDRVARGYVADRVLELLRSLKGVSDSQQLDGFAHSLQTATRVERAGGDDELVVAAVCHDVGKAASPRNHAAIGAEILKPYVRPDVYQVVRTHDVFVRRYRPEGNSDARHRYRRARWYPLAERFADEWDQTSFDPAYDTLPLEHFEARLRTVFAHHRSSPAPRWRVRLSRARRVVGA